jgi:hypothetical protein
VSLEERTDSPATGGKRYAPHDCKQSRLGGIFFLPLKSQEILKRADLWFSTNLEMILLFLVIPSALVGRAFPVE